MMDIDRREATRRKGPIRSGIERRITLDENRAAIARGPDRRQSDRRKGEDRRQIPALLVQEF
jgi:hypothetical protein